MSTRITRMAILSTLGLAAAAATVSAQTAAKPASPKVPAASTAPTENESQYITKLRECRRQLNEVKTTMDSDKNTAMDENRKDFNAGINEAINAIDKEIVARKNEKK